MARIDHLPEQELAPIASAAPNRRRAAWVALVAAGIGSASALLALPAFASDGESPASGGRVLVCTSGVEQNGDIQTSSASATRVAPGDTTPPPAGCELK
ncbi:MAG: hypothetical protein WDA60_04420 [Acidimicrobiia bacterium]|jgi:hypothetical protein